MCANKALLIVDDNPVDHVLIQRLLRQETQAYHFHSADLASRALDIIASTPVDCVLLDYHLPDSDGLEMLSALGVDEFGLTQVPVVMLTGVGSERIAVQALQGGAMDYLIKERLSGPRLAQVVEQAIQRHRLRAEHLARQRYLEQRSEELERSVAVLQERLSEHLERAELLAALEAERASLAQRVTERTADLRKANEALARAAQLKDEFLANMSHELRTPLNAILGRAEILTEELYGSLTPRQAQAVHSIEEAGRHLLSLINDILDLSKVEAGKLELEHESVSVPEVAAAALRMVAEAARSRSVSLSSSSALTHSTIRGDSRRLRQILVNLLSNAVKFTPAGGQVALDIHDDAERQTVTFSVTDTGIGIAPEDQLRLFQPFVQIDSALSRQHDGTGLGLALVHRLAELHGGSVALQSAVGHGSTFQVVLPLAPAGASRPPGAPGADAPAPEAPPAARAGRLVLLAEDNPQSAQLVRDYLAAYGYRVVVSPNGADVIAQAAELRPDIILMDIQMPFVDGLEAMRRIRAAGMAETPIIALTALSMPGDRERCLEAGANDYLTKPVGLAALRAALAQQLEKVPQ